jgi:hypothetical protein
MPFDTIFLLLYTNSRGSIFGKDLEKGVSALHKWKEQTSTKNKKK